MEHLVSTFMSMPWIFLCLLAMFVAVGFMALIALMIYSVYAAVYESYQYEKRIKENDQKV